MSRYNKYSKELVASVLEKEEEKLKVAKLDYDRFVAQIDYFRSDSDFDEEWISKYLEIYKNNVLYCELCLECVKHTFEGRVVEYCHNVLGEEAYSSPHTETELLVLEERQKMASEILSFSDEED